MTALILIEISASTPHAFAANYNVPPDAVPANLNAGDTINVGVGGRVGDDFFAGLKPVAGSTVNVNGGSVAGFFETDGAVNLTSGGIGMLFRTTLNSVFNMHGGSVGQSAEIVGGVWNVYGGTVGGSLHLTSNAVLNVDGGTIADSISVPDAGVVNLRSGELGSSLSGFTGTFNMTGGSIGKMLFIAPAVWNLSGGTVDGAVEIATLNIRALSAQLAGAAIPGLVPGVPMTISQRDVVLSGVLQDGSPFSFNMNSTYQNFNDDFFNLADTVTVTLVPEPSSATIAAAVLACSLLCGGARRRWLRA